MKGWWRKVTRNNDQRSSSTSHLLYSFPSLSSLRIVNCPELEFLPLCPSLDSLAITFAVNAKLIPQLLSTRDSPSSSSSSSSSLARLDFHSCNELTSLPAGSLTSLSSLSIRDCENLKDVVVPPSHLNNLEVLYIYGCPELELWEEKKTGVDWDSLPNLLTLHVEEVPSPERLPNCLRNRQADGNLQIIEMDYDSQYYFHAQYEQLKKRMVLGYRHRPNPLEILPLS